MNTTNQSFKYPIVAMAAAAATVGALAVTYTPEPTTYTPAFTANTAPSQYELLQLRMTDNHKGQAVIRLDGFRITTTFEVEAFEDNYGVPDSEFTAVDVTSLDDVQVFDATGKRYNDFTDHIDHRNMNALIKAHIEKHRLVTVGDES